MKQTLQAVATLIVIYMLVLASAEPADLAVGVLVAVGALAVARRAPAGPRTGGLRSLLWLMPFLAAVFVDVAKGTWEVALVVVGLRPLRRPGFVEIPVEDRSETGIVVASTCCTCWTPPTLIAFEQRTGAATSATSAGRCRDARRRPVRRRRVGRGAAARRRRPSAARAGSAQPPARARHALAHPDRAAAAPGGAGRRCPLPRRGARARPSLVHRDDRGSALRLQGATVLIAYVADGLILLGLVVMTVGVIGLFRMPDVYLQLHAASKAVVLGVVAVALATVATGETAVIARALLISAALVLTTPVGSHAIARAAFRQDERAGRGARQ